MAVRSSMSALISKLRGMAGDTSATADRVFSDQNLQDILDTHRTDVRYLQLTPVTSFAAGGVVTYTRFYSTGYTDWETDAVFQDGDYTVITPTSTDYQVGMFDWDTDQAANLPIFITGKCYDMYGSAADVCEQWAAKEAIVQDIENAGISETWMYKQKNLLKQAELYRARSGFIVSTISRSDLN